MGNEKYCWCLAIRHLGATGFFFSVGCIFAAQTYQRFSSFCFRWILFTLYNISARSWHWPTWSYWITSNNQYVLHFFILHFSYDRCRCHSLDTDGNRTRCSWDPKIASPAFKMKPHANENYTRKGVCFRSLPQKFRIYAALHLRLPVWTPVWKGFRAAP